MLTLGKIVLKTVTFICNPKIDANKVFLAGDFNQWQPRTKPMIKSKDGFYRASVKLPPGEYQYKFVVDGVWFNDPQADSQVINRHGTLNSVIWVK